MYWLFLSQSQVLANRCERILEVFVGIICACTPAAAKSCNHHLKNLSALKTTVISQLSRIGLSTKQSQASLLSRKGDHQPGQYSNIDIYQGPGHTGNAKSKGIQTFIHNGKQHDLENDGIHLTIEMENQISQARYPGHEMATPLDWITRTMTMPSQGWPLIMKLSRFS